MRRRSISAQLTYINFHRPRKRRPRSRILRHTRKTQHHPDGGCAAPGQAERGSAERPEGFPGETGGEEEIEEERERRRRRGFGQWRRGRGRESWGGQEEEEDEDEDQSWGHGNRWGQAKGKGMSAFEWNVPRWSRKHGLISGRRYTG